MDQQPVIVWFRKDLRIKDNPALSAAAATAAPVLGLYIYDDAEPHQLGAASKWWLHHSLTSLATDLKNLGSDLILRRGDSKTILPMIAEELKADKIFWNRRYFTPHVNTDKSLKTILTNQGCKVETFNGSLLREPWTITNKTGSPYKVFTPFWRALRTAVSNDPLHGPVISSLAAYKKTVRSDNLDSWKLTTATFNTQNAYVKYWAPGEHNAQNCLHTFLEDCANTYTDGRDRPDLQLTSRLSPHLAFGEISPARIWQDTEMRIANGDVSVAAGEKFLSELAWRDFSYSQLFYNPHLPEAPLSEQFNHYPWHHDKNLFDQWKRGKTGYPIVDAGMRQLQQTGWMHNRVRMIVASFLIKDLLIDWRKGAAYFWDALVDADLASNSASWQWVAGCGADAAPYFRIFNPVLQGKKFDPNGDYVRRFIPELANLPKKYIHAPWKAPFETLQHAEITLGKTYPRPNIEHDAARKIALAGYERMKRKVVDDLVVQRA